MQDRIKILFILKRKETYNDEYNQGRNVVEDGGYGMETGLLNSASFVNDMLNHNNFDSHLVVVHDNNDIDREVTKYRPDIVVLEALWVVPEKFAVLLPLHPKVKWIVRLHSATPFISNEGIAMKWILSYISHKNVSVSCNDDRILKEIRFLIKHKFQWGDIKMNKKVLYQPNFYPLKYKNKELDRNKEVIDIACFGAIRPMKNQLIQAVAALEFADSIGKKLHFHINGNRVEMKGAPVLHNIVALFEHVEHRGHKLIIHDWCSHSDFKKVCSEMDIALQVSFTETFNIVAADLVSEGVPLVASSEVKWSTTFGHADPNDVQSIVKKLKFVWRYPQFNVFLNQRFLKRYCKNSVVVWKEELKKLC